MTNIDDLTPKKIVAELNRYIVGQDRAKKAVAIALRNRWRRKQVEDKNLREDIVPKNILMMGATGVGKTEIARRLAKITNAPFIKVEATKFTEIGYVGKDIESIIRELMDIAVNMTREKMRKEVEEHAKKKTFERLVIAIIGEGYTQDDIDYYTQSIENGEMDSQRIDIDVQEQSSSSHNLSTFDIPGMPGGRGAMINIGEIFTRAIGAEKMRTMNLTMKEAYNIVLKEESDKLIDEDRIIKEAIEITESEGIVFLDEIDKIAAKSSSDRGEISREGVQRDLLPLIEGTVVSTKYGSIRTDHILFIASGAFHIAKPADLLPELQGRLPIRVELDNLTQEDLVKILREPENSLIKQYVALLKTEGIDLIFTDESIEKIAGFAREVNESIENIGARRLHTMLEKLLEDIAYNADEYKGKEFKINEEYVEEHLGHLVHYEDLSKFVL